MSDAYKKVNAGRLTFKGGDVATRSKSIDKKHKKKKKTLKIPNDAVFDESAALVGEGELEGAKAVEEEKEDVYTIDAAKKMNYDELFPVEARKFGYDPKEKKKNKSVEEALDDRVKKKADRYCK